MNQFPKIFFKEKNLDKVNTIGKIMMYTLEIFYKTKDKVADFINGLMVHHIKVNGVEIE